MKKWVKLLAHHKIRIKMNTPNWSTFKKRIHIYKSKPDVYTAWATKSHIEHWLLERADYKTIEGKLRESHDFIRKGDEFTWKWNNWEKEEKGEILKANGTAISFTFGDGGTVHVELDDKKGATEVILTQENVPTDENSRMQLFVGFATGWTFWLTNLKAWLEHGLTLHATGLSQDETDDLVNC